VQGIISPIAITATHKSKISFATQNQIHKVCQSPWCSLTMRYATKMRFTQLGCLKQWKWNTTV
jgi:hypothetical protein